MLQRVEGNSVRYQTLLPPDIVSLIRRRAAELDMTQGRYLTELVERDAEMARKQHEKASLWRS